MLDNKAAIEEIRNRASIVELASRHTRTKQTPSGVVANCPFHDDKSPSMTLSEEKGLYHCFGCGEGGDIFTFVMNIEGVGFGEALQRLAQETGVELEGQEAASDFAMMRELANNVALYYFDRLLTPGGKRCREYLINRGVSEETMSKFKMGFAPPFADHLEQNFPSDIEALQELGFINGHKQAFFRKRILFPLLDANGNCIGFTGRAMGDESPKYINTRGTKYFEKGKQLYGMHLAQQAIKDNGSVLIVEGHMDVVMCHQFGLSHAVASMGTAFTQHHARLLKRFTDNAIVAFDSDSAGQTAALKCVKRLIEAGVSVKVVALPSGEDPDSVLVNKGREAFEAMLDKAQDLAAYFIGYSLRTFDVSTLEGKQKMISQAGAFLRDLSDVATKSHIIEELASALSIPVEDIRMSLDRPVRPAKETDTEQTLSWSTEEHLLALLLQGVVHPNRVVADLQPSDFAQFPNTMKVIFDLSDNGLDITEGATLTKLTEKLSNGEQEKVRELSLSQVRDADTTRAAEQLIGRIKSQSLGRTVQDLQTQLEKAEADQDQEKVIELAHVLMQKQKERIEVTKST